MILSEKTGIITSFKETKSKAGKPLLIITHSIGNSNKLNTIFIFEGDENFNNLSMLGQDLIGAKIEAKTEIITE